MKSTARIHLIAASIASLAFACSASDEAPGSGAAPSDPKASAGTEAPSDGAPDEDAGTPAALDGSAKSDGGTAKSDGGGTASCAGMDGTADVKLKLVDTVGIFGLPTLPPTRFSYATAPLGLQVIEGSRLDLGSARVAIGTSSFDTSTRYAVGISGGPPSVSAGDLVDHLGLPKPDAALTTYNTTFNDEFVPTIWGYAAATPPNTMTFYNFRKVSGPVAVLGSLKRGPNWVPGVDAVTRVRMVAYAAYTLHVSFDSPCKRAQYETIAGGTEASKAFAGTPQMKAFLKESKASITVYALAVGIDSAIRQLITQSACGSADPAACATLVTSLNAQIASVGSGTPTYTTSPTGSNGWVAESMTFQDTSFLSP